MKRKCVQWIGYVGMELLVTLSAMGQVVLNEFMAANGGAVLGPNGEPSDYLEVCNTSPNVVSLAGWTLTDNTNSPAKFAFPSGATIPGRGFVVVWLDSATNDPGYHATFALDAAGERVALYQSGLLRDQVDFGLQVGDKPLGRIPDGTGAWALGNPTPGAPNRFVTLGAVLALRLNEWMATNSAGHDKDWLEIYNPFTNGPVALGGLVISSQTTNVDTPAIVPLSYLDSGAFARFWCDKDPAAGANHLDFRLSRSGETLSILLPDRMSLVDRVVFGLQSTDSSMGRLPDGGANFLQFPVGRDTPGESNFLPLTNVVVNELLAHTDLPLEDAVEFYNPTPDPVNIGGWWLSNNQDNPRKYRIPANTMIAAFGFKVFYEYQFNASGTGNSPDFNFNSASGDQICLFTADSAGNLTGYRLVKDFGPSQNGVSFGRYLKSTGGTDFVPMSGLSLGSSVTASDPPAYLALFRTGAGATNPYPKVGPVVISEIMYHPPDLAGKDNSLDEFIELRNITSASVPLYFTNDYAGGNSGWRLQNAVEYAFPTNLASLVVMPSQSRLLVVKFDPLADAGQLAFFRSQYHVPTIVPIVGPYAGNLDNHSAALELYRPDTVQKPPHPDAGLVPYLLVEKIKYEDRAPWPVSPDGGGHSLQRLSLTGYANDPANWFGAPPTAGADYVSSSFAMPKVLSNGTVQLTLNGTTGQTYGIEASTNLMAWINLVTLTNATMPVIYLDSSATNHPRRFYRSLQFP